MDFKSIKIQPAKLQETFIAFANSDGGDLYIGIEDSKVKTDRIRGFKQPEEANDAMHVLLEETSPAVENVETEFIDFGKKGLVLHFIIPKSPKVHYTTQHECFIRINARKKNIKGERITELGYAKGILSYEHQAVIDADIDDLVDGEHLRSYMQRVETTLSPERFLKKQRLLTKKDGDVFPNVGAILLFDDEPQATLSTRCALKVYRLRTTESQYKREQLAGMPKTLNGPIEKQIADATNSIQEALLDASYHEQGKIVKRKYPTEAIKEILVNAVIHRDYSLNDDIHIRIYDNRIEIQSPGRLPGYITAANIWDERFSRNPNLVRVLHNLPNPVNHDIGEGLNTARNELKKAGLVAPDIQELDNAVVVTIKHQRLASIEDVILNYFKEHPKETITNKQARQLSGEDDVNKVKKALQKLRKQGIIEPVNKSGRAFDFQYRLVATD